MERILFLCSILIICYTSSAVELELKKSDYICTNNYATLECPKNFVIFVTKTEHLYRSGQCVDEHSVDYDSKGKPSQLHCKGIDETCEYYKTECNGKTSCNIKAVKKSHQVGVFGGNCDFESNIVNIHYTCVPSKPTKTFFLDSF